MLEIIIYPIKIKHVYGGIETHPRNDGNRQKSQRVKVLHFWEMVVLLSKKQGKIGKVMGKITYSVQFLLLKDA